uniref:ATP synthase F0 subunit 8 n=1 Tax=Yininemertes pratensis TaxID=2057967 RepID=A0A7U3VK60_9BILA|nr:ATP synthase F0 subunit 8 [Yininemertes pratensis]QQP01058.1 ATP synthase F0 subunit 8 [Yininemertes pratensis]
MPQLASLSWVLFSFSLLFLLGVVFCFVWWSSLSVLPLGEGEVKELDNYCWMW